MGIAFAVRLIRLLRISDRGHASGHLHRGVPGGRSAAVLGRHAGLGNRLDLLRDFVPLPILELLHLLGSAVGVGLLIIAHGLYRRLDAAWWLTIYLLCAGILLSLLKGFDYEEATILGLVASSPGCRRAAASGGVPP